MTDNPAVALLARIEASNLAPEDRKLLVDALALGDYTGKHEYPSRHGPGSHPTTTAAWAILDQLPPDAMKRHHRFQLAGLIAGAFFELQRGKR